MCEFLVHRHLLMNHLAFRRDTSDERLVVDFAVEVGSPELLDTLYVLTAADLAAVGPGVWDGWKEEIVTTLYRRAMRHLAGEVSAVDVDERVAQRRRAAAAVLGRRAKDAWFARQIEALPAAYLSGA
jgi:[protein-PII] uridylyltransferase